jgi:hypothetical protein
MQPASVDDAGTTIITTNTITPIILTTITTTTAETGRVHNMML